MNRDTGWVNDIAYLGETLPKVHKDLFFHLPEEEFHRQLEELKSKVPHYTDEQIGIELSVILASLGDTHTGTRISAETIYPLDLHWFAEGIYSIGTNQENAELLDGRIISLNGRKIEEVAEALRPLVGEANESWFKTRVQSYLPIPEVLQYFALSSTEDIELEVERPSGDVVKATLTPIKIEDYALVARDEKPLPLYQSQGDQNYWYEYLEAEKILYFNYSRCQEMNEKPYKSFNRELWDVVQTHEPETLVLDLRSNGGGNSSILNPFIKALEASKFNQPGKFCVVIGRDTFSSAILNALTLKEKTKAYFVGEPTGGEPNHYGEVKQFTLPNSEKAIGYSTKYFRWVDEDLNTLEPDKLIEETFASYQEGRDPVLEWIIEQN